MLILPMVLPFALLGHPRQFGIMGLLLAASLAAAATGLVVTLLLARTIGPRAARTVGQILAALLGGGFYLVSQLTRLSHEGTQAGLYGWFRARHLGEVGPSGWPGLAAFAGVEALACMLVPAGLLFAAAGGLLQATFLSGYQDGTMRLHRRRSSRRIRVQGFHTGLRGAVFAKEWRLLARDPALAFQLILRLIYVAPIVLIAFRHGDGPPLGPTLAFMSVLISSQLAGSLAWLTISAEDAPELLTTAPVAVNVIRHAKLFAAIAMTTPLAIIGPLAILIASPLGTIVTLLMTTLAAWCCGLIELHLGKPGQRAKFARRQRGSFGTATLELLIAVAFGGVAALATWWMG